MPFADATFSAVACLTMLHHLPVSELQDRLFVEVHRVLGPEGVFCGSDNPGRGFNFASSTSATARLSSIQTPSGRGCTPWRSSTPGSARIADRVPRSPTLLASSTLRTPALTDWRLDPVPAGRTCVRAARRRSEPQSAPCTRGRPSRGCRSTSLCAGSVNPLCWRSCLPTVRRRPRAGWSTCPWPLRGGRRRSPSTTPATSRPAALVDGGSPQPPYA
jgi:hypothetical protein